jgi:hypothetical protein
MATQFTTYVNAGTIAVVASNDLVNLTGYSWADLIEGDVLEAQGRMTSIKTLVTPTQVQLLLPWSGTTASGIPYVAWKNSKSRFDPSLTQAALREYTEKLRAAGIVYNVAPGAVPDNAIGEDGQWALRLDGSGTTYWQKIGGVWVPQAGSAELRAFQ